MNLQEAYSILELSQGASQDEAKKKYRELTKKYHPDINKEPGAEDKFKKINEAYGCIQSGKGTDIEEPVFTRNPFSGFGFNPFGNQRQRNYQPRHIQINETISFKESVFGCKKNISFNRKIKCPDCNGEGEQKLNNGCDKCHGIGTVTMRQGNMIFAMTCDKCGGMIKSQPCDKCNSTGAINSEASVEVNVPGGIRNGNILRLSGMGDFVGNFMSSEQHTDAHLLISVTPHPLLKLIDNDVVSTLTISLLESLTGCSKSIETLNGVQEIEIKPKSRNKEEVIIPKLGVNRIGSQRVIFDVQYPDDVSHLAEFLSIKNEITT